MGAGRGGAGKPNYDQALKRLLVRGHDGFLALIAPGLTWLGELSPELPATARQADLAWKAAGPDGMLQLVHIELQVKPEADIGERLAEYGLRLYRREHLAVRSVVVFLKPAQTLPQSPFGWDIMGQARERYVFDVVRLWEIPAEQVLSTTNYDLWPLSALMAGSSVASVVRVAERIAAAPLPRQERGELTGALLLLASLRTPRRFLATAIRRTDMLKDLLSESEFPELMHDLFGGEWEKKARAEAHAEGEVAGLRESVRLVLHARFGTLDDALSEAIEHSRENELRAVLGIAATGSPQEIRASFGMK
ncbi:MAG: hypothetical protein ACRDHP_00970 [Ktedonobacterales bacterium]